MPKRSSSGEERPAKRGREDAGAGDADAGALVVAQTTALVEHTQQAPGRTSSLAAPNMLFEGHEAAVFALAFDPTGAHLASGSKDRKVFLWNSFDEDNNNYLVLEGHKNAVLDLGWTSDSATVVTASADATLGLWDAQTGQRTKKFAGHAEIVNACSAARRGPQLVASASDDATVRLWDARQKAHVTLLQHQYQLTAVAFGDSTEQVITGGLDNVVRVWDVRKEAVLHELRGHTDTITGLSLSPDGTHVLSNAMDNTLRRWDVKPFAAGDRCVATYTGHVHNFERLLLRCAWSPDGDKVTAGSADRMLNVWDAMTAELQYQLPGHQGSINAVAFHPLPTEPVVASGSSDGQIFLGELA